MSRPCQSEHKHIRPVAAHTYLSLSLRTSSILSIDARLYSSCPTTPSIGHSSHHYLPQPRSVGHARLTLHVHLLSINSSTYSSHHGSHQYEILLLLTSNTIYWLLNHRHFHQPHLNRPCSTHPLSYLPAPQFED